MIAVLAVCGCKQTAAPPTTEEAEALAKDFAAKLGPCDTEAIYGIIDTDEVFARAWKTRHGAFEGVEFRGRFGGLDRLLCSRVPPGMSRSATYLGTLDDGDAPRPVVRVVSELGLNYYMLELDNQHGATRISDIYIMSAGENLSEIVGWSIDIERRGAVVASELKDLDAQIAASRWPEAHSRLLALSPELRALKSVKLREITITGELGNDAYVRAVDDFAKAFPGDPAVVLQTIARALVRNDHGKALEYLADLDKRVGGDPYLDVLRARAWQSAGKLEQALAMARRATQREPTLEAAWWQLLLQQAASERYADAIPTIDVLRDRFGAKITPQALAADARFNGLAASREYAAWRERQ